MRVLLRISVLLFAVVAAAQPPNFMGFSFTVPPGDDANVSAAVYNATGEMIRVLWPVKKFAPGNYSRQWDGMLQDHVTPAPIGVSYTIRVMMNYVVYTYDGRIGSTEKAINGMSFWRNLQNNGSPIFTFAGGKGWGSGIYAEGGANVLSFTDMNNPNLINQDAQSSAMEIVDLATDGTWVYLTNAGVAFGGQTAAQTPTYTTALDAASGTPVVFTNGTPWTGLAIAGWPFVYATNTTVGSWTNTTLSTIDVSNVAAGNVPVAVAVQRSGNILAISHGAGGINLFDKHTGSALGTIGTTTIANATSLAFNSEGLWAVSAGNLYLISGVGSTNTVTQPIASGSSPSTINRALSVGTNGLLNNIFVMDGGNQQQMKEFAPNTHAPMRQYGDLGGFSNCNPNVSKTRLMLDRTYADSSTTAYPTWVRADDNDNVWFTDGGNSFRIIHVSASNNYIDRMMYMRPTYEGTVSRSDPTRLFNRNFEFSINYSVPLQMGDPDPALGGNGSWELVRNWAVCSGTSYNYVSRYQGGPSVVETLSNGHTYAMYGWGGSTGSAGTLFEMPSNGNPIRAITTTVPTTGAPQYYMMLPTGDMSGAQNASGSAPSYILNVSKASLTGFDASFNPQWGPWATVASATTNAQNFYMSYPSGNWPMPAGAEVTTDGVYPVYTTQPFATQPCTTSNWKTHLGGIHTGGTFPTYYWATLPEVDLRFPDYEGGFACNRGAGGTGGRVPPRVEGQNIFVMYDGQYVSWGNQYWHYWSDGMMIGQFGQNTSYPGTTVQNGSWGLQSNNGGGSVVLGMTYGDTAGNILAYATTTVNGDVYLYHPDEAWGNLARWHISNLASIREFAGTAILAPGAFAELQPITLGAMPASAKLPARKKAVKKSPFVEP